MSWLAELTFPKEFPLRLGKMLKTRRGQGKAGLAAHRGAQPKAPAPGCPELPRAAPARAARLQGAQARSL